MTAARASLAVWAMCVLMAVPTIVLLIVGPGHTDPDDLFSGLGGASFLLLALTLASIGAVVACRVPGNRIGPLFCAIGFANCLQLLSWQYADVGLHAHPLPGAATVEVVNSIEGEATAGLLALPLLLFPDGRLPSARWRPALALLLIGTGLLVVAGTFQPGRYAEPFASVSNPLGLPGTRAVMDAVDLVGWLLVLIAGFAVGVAALVFRLRRAHGVERQQLKFVLVVGPAAAAGCAALMATWLIWPSGGLQLRIAGLGLCLTALPAAAGIAILRYRLYDIDVVVKRTLVYGFLTTFLAATYVALVLLLQLALGSFVSGGGLAVALSTLAVAALFRPARNRIQAGVDRRFDRSRYNAERTLAAFTAHLRETVDLDALRRQLTAVGAETMHPAHLSLWLKESE
jgi:hypothetical protein